MTFTLDSDLNETSAQFTLTCNSTGGPATTVTWTRDSVNITNGTETVLNDRETSQYTHTLTVTGGEWEDSTHVLWLITNHLRIQLLTLYKVLVIVVIQYIKPSGDLANYIVEGIQTK